MVSIEPIDYLRAMSTLAEIYDTDFYAWTRLQTRELRRLKGSRHNAELDLDHLIEEVFGLGNSARMAALVRSSGFSSTF